MASLSLCMIARDEERFLPEALKSVENLVDEIILGVDDRTQDATADIAMNCGARVRVFTWEDDFSAARNLGLDEARTDWILVIDPDERLTDNGRDEIRDAVRSDNTGVFDGYRIEQVDKTLDGKTLWRGWTAVRLFRNSPDLRFRGRVHEEVRYIPDPKLTSARLLPGLGPHMRHLGNDPTILELRRKPERNRRLLTIRVDENPEDAVAWYYLARMALADGDNQRAVDCAKKALQFGPLQFDAVANLERIVAEYS